MRNIQSYADIETARDKGELTPAEEQFIDCCREGRLCELNHGTRPAAPNPTHKIGADLLRYLITGGGEGCVLHDRGVRLAGAYVANPLELDFATAKGATTLENCHFEHKINATHTQFEQLSLEGSHLSQGLFAQAAKVTGSIFLRNGFVATGLVDLNSTDIGGQLNCAASHFIVTKGDALNAQGAKIAGGVFLSDGFTAKGPVDFTNADIGVQLNCDEGSFKREKGIALQLQDSRAKAFFWRKITAISGKLDLNGAHFSEITDDQDSWDRVDSLTLTGLTYDHLTSPGDTRKRLEWLGKGDRMNGEFSPQPYTQLAKVLRDMGHDGDARRVLITKEDRLRHARTSGLAPITRTRNFLFRWLVGYGYRPFNCLWALVLMIAIGSFVAQRAWNAGDFAPNSDVILSTADWQNLAEDDTIKNPALEWSDRTAKGRDYETFQPIAYGFDVVVPIVNIGQEAAWAPSTTRGPCGWHLWWLRWVLSILGWVVTAVGAAAITGIIRQD